MDNLKGRSHTCEQFSPTEIKASEIYKSLSATFSTEAVDLLLGVVFEDPDIIFYDELLSEGGINYEALMKIVRFQPTLYRLFTEVEDALEMLLSVRDDDFYEACIKDSMDVKAEGDVPSRTSLSFLAMNAFSVFANSFELEDGMLRTILMLHAHRYFQAHFMERLSVAAAKMGKSEFFTEAVFVPTLALAREIEADEELAHASLINHGADDYFSKLKFIKMLRSEAFQRALFNFPFASDRTSEHWCNNVVEASALKTVTAGRYRVGAVEVQVEGAHIFKDERRSSTDAFLLAFVDVELPEKEGMDSYMFDVYRDGRIVLNQGRYDLKEAFDPVNGAALLDVLEKTIYSALLQHLQSLAPDEYLDLSPEKKVVDSTSTDVSKVVDIESPKDLPLSALGSISSIDLKRRLDKILGPPVRISGSHQVYVSRQDGISVPVPVHGGKDMKRGTLKSVLEALGVSVRELKNL